MLLLASFIFYGAWDWKFLFLLSVTITCDYFLALKIARSKEISRKKLFVVLSVFVNLTILGFFKYFNFFASSLESLLLFMGFSVHPRLLNIILPVGISFYTFQSMSYIIDVYRGKVKPAVNILDFALFVSYFPQLVAGPIERASHLLPQVLSPRVITTEKFYLGMRLILWGLFKKIVVADRLALYVDAVYGNVYNHSGITFALATLFFAFQIYCDFAGYSDIARGLGSLMGFDIMVNFRNPYFANNIRDFWQRWHISLSTWLRDYLYIPLGGNRKGRLNTVKNILITMFLGGLWHGANWTFVIWGLLHGLFIVITKLAQESFSGFRAQLKINKLFCRASGILVTFAFVLLTWVFFRASGISEAYHILESVLSFSWGKLYIGSVSNIIYGVCAVIFLILMEIRAEKRGTADVLKFESSVMQYAVSYCIIFAIILFGVNKGQQFIYFQF